MNTKKLCLMGLLMALTCVATMIIRVPINVTGGYVNIGDSMVLICAIFFGPEYGFLAGGLGSGLADLIGGYPAWFIATFIIKGIEGFLVSKLAGTNNETFLNVRKILACAAGLIWMVAGYFVADAIINGSVIASLKGVPSNCLQAVFSFVVFVVLGLALHKAKITNYIK